MIAAQIWLDRFVARLLQLKPDLSALEAQRIASTQSNGRARCPCWVVLDSASIAYTHSEYSAFAPFTASHRICRSP